MRKRLVRRLVDRLIYTSDSLHAYYNRTAKIQIPTSAKSAQETSENPSEVSPSNIYWLQKKKSRPGGQLLDACASVVSSGGGCPKVLEPRTLTVRRSYPIQWKRERVDLAELANLRWIKKWRIERIAAHLDLGTTSVKRELAKIRSQKGQMALDKRIRKAIDQEAVRGFRGC